MEKRQRRIDKIMLYIIIFLVISNICFYTGYRIKKEQVPKKRGILIEYILFNNGLLMDNTLELNNIEELSTKYEIKLLHNHKFHFYPIDVEISEFYGMNIETDTNNRIKLIYGYKP